MYFHQFLPIAMEKAFLVASDLLLVSSKMLGIVQTFWPLRDPKDPWSWQCLEHTNSVAPEKEYRMVRITWNGKVGKGKIVFQ